VGPCTVEDEKYLNLEASGLLLIDNSISKCLLHPILLTVCEDNDCVFGVAAGGACWPHQPGQHLLHERHHPVPPLRPRTQRCSEKVGNTLYLDTFLAGRKVNAMIDTIV